MAIEEENDIIEIIDDDGTAIKCRLLDIVEVEGKQYAVLSELPEGQTDENVDEEQELVLMRMIENEDNDEVYFETIDNDEEFEKVQSYLESIIEEAEKDEE